MNLKIVYFDFPFWRAEVARISLFKGNIRFDDIRVNGDDFKFIKEHGKMKDGTLVLNIICGENTPFFILLDPIMVLTMQQAKGLLLGLQEMGPLRLHNTMAGVEMK